MNQKGCMPAIGKKLIFLSFAILTIPTVSLAKGSDSFLSAQIYFALPYNYTHFDEFEADTSSNYDHRAIALGLGIGGRVGFRIGYVGLGAVGELDIFTSGTTREDLHIGFASGNYANSIKRELGGGYLYLGVPEAYLLGEYYGYAKNTYTWSEDKAVNRFQKGNIHKGNGWGVGLGRSFFEIVQLVFIYREINYKNADFKNDNYALPTSAFEVINEKSISAQFGLGF